jgi:hypothetical protein
MRPDQGSAERVNLIVCGSHDYWLNTLVETISLHPDINFLEAEDFDDVDGGLKSFPLKNHDPVFTSLTGCKDAFDVIGRRLSGKSKYIGWSPPYFMEFAHVHWTAIQFLPDARYVFCLRNPLDATYARYLAHKHSMPSTFEEALDLCEEEMKRIGFFENRNKWNRFFINPSPVSLLLQSSVYYPTIARCLRFLSSGRIHVFAFERFQGSPGKTMEELCRFLDIPASSLPNLKLPVENEEISFDSMKTETRQRLSDFFAEFNRKLYDLLGWKDICWK